MCEDEPDARDGVEESASNCLRCPMIDLKKLSVPMCIRHVAAHLLHDRFLKDADNPCGFCLRTGSSCSIRLKKNGRGDLQIDLAASRCPNIGKLSLKPAAEFKKKSPCTNHPMVCPLCPKGCEAVWKYNLRTHIVSTHPTATLMLYQDLYTVTREEKAAMQKYLKVAHHVKKLSRGQQYKISEAHTTRLSHR